jgi:hypothetical protein
MFKIYGSRILSQIFSTDKYILGIISDGFGNKLYMITLYIYLYFKINMYQKLDKIYLVYKISDHERGEIEERLDYIFPKIKKLEFIKFINWNDYKKLKIDMAKDSVYINSKKIRQNKFSEIKLPIKYFDYNFDKKYFLEYKNYFMDLFTFRDSFKKLDNQFDFNIPLIHIRLGDKLYHNYKCVIEKKDVHMFALYTPEFYRDISVSFNKVYVSTDSPELFNLYYRKVLNKKVILIDQPFYNILYLMTKFKRIVLSDSTLSVFASYLNKNLVKCYGHKFIVERDLQCNKKKIGPIRNKLLLSNVELLEDDKYFLHNNRKLLKEIYEFSIGLKGDQIK